MAPERICIGCSADMLRNGRRPFRYVDAVEHRTVVRELRIQRYVCPRCGLCDEDETPPLRRGFRLSRDAFDLVGAHACLASHGDVAAVCAVDRGTVQAVWTAWMEERMASSPAPDVCMLRPHQGMPDTILAFDVSGGLLACLPPLSEASSFEWLDGIGLSLVHPSLAPYFLSSEGLAERSVFRRVDVARWTEDALPSILEDVATWLEPAARRALRDAVPALLTPAALRTGHEDELVGRLTGRGREVERVISRLRRVWSTTDPAAGRDRLAEWIEERSSFARSVTRSLTERLELVSRRLFAGPYADFDDLSTDEIVVPPFDRGASLARKRGLTFAFNHRATRAILDELSIATGPRPGSDANAVLEPSSALQAVSGQPGRQHEFPANRVRLSAGVNS